jgi:hypothetical protein
LRAIEQPFAGLTFASHQGPSLMGASPVFTDQDAEFIVIASYFIFLDSIPVFLICIRFIDIVSIGVKTGVV